MSFMTRICFRCKHFHYSDASLTCDAFPDGIPMDVFREDKHINNIDGDNGIKYEEEEFVISGANNHNK